jgi:signal transduction histidine kinase
VTFRLRVGLAVAAGAMIPLLLLTCGVRRETTGRLVSQGDERVQLAVAGARQKIDTEGQAIANRLDRLAVSLADNNQFRLAVATGETAVPWLRDWARDAMLQSDLDHLELVDSTGSILSSGHFRNEFGQRHAGLARAVEAETTAAILRARAPAGQFDALVRSRSLLIGGRQLFLVGGVGLDLSRLLPATDPEVTPRFVAGDSVILDPAPLATIPLVLLTLSDTVALTPAAIVLTRDVGPMLALRRSLDRWFLGATVVVLLLSTALALWLSSRVSRPLVDLAEKTQRLDLDRLDQSFDNGRADEIGALGRVLDAMTERIRASAGRLREAERRAATGDLARQINHDVKNGLAPIRHVLRHLSQVATEKPGDLAGIFRERQGTLESSVTYLENLSRNYARLSPTPERESANPNELLEEIARALAGQVPIDLKKGEALELPADGVALRRILENLAGNAVDAARETGGGVTLASEAFRKDGFPWVRLTVADTGKGMSSEELEKAFDDFYTTKQGGTGLGLSVVRRLVADLGGTLRVTTVPGQGSRFTVELPAGGAG